MKMTIDSDLERRIVNEVKRMADLLDSDPPPVSFEQATVLDFPVHTAFNDDTIQVSRQSALELSIDQIRTCIAFNLAVRVWVNENYDQVKKAVDAGATAEDLEQIKWKRMSEIDALAYRLVGDIEPVIEYVQTKGYRQPDENLPDQPDVVERRITALKCLYGL